MSGKVDQNNPPGNWLALRFDTLK